MLEPGGRFAFTVEEGRPLGAAERAQMPDADTVWPVEPAELTALLHEAGLSVIAREECSASHSATAAALLQAFRDDRAEISRQIGTQAPTELITAYELWSGWLRRGRVRELALVAEKR